METPNQPAREKKSPLGSIVFVLMIVFMYLAYPLVKRVALDVSGVDAVGTVIEVVDRGRNSAPVVQFTTQEGETIEFRGASTNFLSYTKGEEVGLRYLAAYPKIVELNDMRYITYTIALCSEGFVLPVLAVLIFVWIAELRGGPFVLDLSRFRRS